MPTHKENKMYNKMKEAIAKNTTRQQARVRIDHIRNLNPKSAFYEKYIRAEEYASTLPRKYS